MTSRGPPSPPFPAAVAAGSHTGLQSAPPTAPGAPETPAAGPLAMHDRPQRDMWRRAPLRPCGFRQIASFHSALLICVVLVLCTSPVVSATRAAELSTGVSGSATATAYVRYCDDDSPASPPGCLRQLVVDITLDDRTLAGSVLEAEVTVAGAQHESLFPPAHGSPHANASWMRTVLMISFSPIRIALRRGNVQVRYGLTYLRKFPAALRDYVQVLGGAISCDDEASRCPSYTNMEGTLVEAPSGLCCLCVDARRAAENNVFNASTRAHFCFRAGAAGQICVQNEGITYDGWATGFPDPSYEVDITAAGLGISSSSLQLTTDAQVKQNGVSAAQLIQTYNVFGAVVNAQPNLSRRVLFVPSAENGTGNGGPSDWMLMPSSLVSVAGNECDKIGLTPEYFYSLSSASQCAAPSGTCVRHQIADYRAEDLARMSRGEGALYSATSLGAFTWRTFGTQNFLFDAVQRTGGVKLRWTMNADSLAYTPLPVSGTLGSLSYAGGTDTLSVTVHNPNDYAGLYYVAIQDCHLARASACDGDGVNHECAHQALVFGHGNSSVSFQMDSGKASAADTAAAFCRIELRDASNATLMSSEISWQRSLITTTPAPAVSKVGQCRRCSFSDLLCLLSEVCEREILAWTVMIMAATWVPYAGLACWRWV